MKMKFDKSIPYFKALMQAPAKNRMMILQSFPHFVIDHLVEIIFNAVMGNVKLSSKSRKLAEKHKKALKQITVAARNKNKRRSLIYKQKGGFIGAILPFLTSALGGILANV